MLTARHPADQRQLATVTDCDRVAWGPGAVGCRLHRGYSEASDGPRGRTQFRTVRWHPTARLDWHTVSACMPLLVYRSGAGQCHSAIVPCTGPGATLFVAARSFQLALQAVARVSACRPCLAI